MRVGPVRRGILALDIEGFGEPRRTDSDRSRLRARLRALLRHALTIAQIPPAQVAECSDLGDGILVLFDPAVSAATILHPLVTRLVERLASGNETTTGPGRLRLRVAVHEGYVLADGHGHSGADLNHAFRLLDAQAVREVLAGSPSADAVLVVSDPVYQGIVRHAYEGLDPAGWQPIRVHAKETRTRAWVHLPGLPRQPHLPAVLAASAVGPSSLPIPRELPSATRDFTGRTDQLDELARLLDRDASAAAGPVVISAIDGMGGIGKSALAIQAANRVAGVFPDGQLYVDLHGATPGQPPRPPLDALGAMLRSLAVDAAQIPADEEEAAARWRSLAAERRLLVLLDNARSAEQVRPLLPASPTCAVLITSRQVLATLDGAYPVHLDVLPPRQALELLGRIVGMERVAAAPKAADEVVRFCGFLPLAIRIAGARLYARPNWPVSELADRLAEAAGRLDELTVQGLGVRAAFDVSLDALQHSPDPVDRAAVSLFGLLSMPDGPDIDAASAARLLDRSEPATRALLERLVDAHLLETPRPGRYRFHDLVRLYARHHAADRHREADRLAALTRLFGFYTATTWHTLELLRPGDQRLAAADARWTSGGLRFSGEAAALEWLEAERANLLAAIRQTAAAAPAIPAVLASQLAQALHGFLTVRSYWRDGVEANQTALRLAYKMGDRTARAHARNDLGVSLDWLGRHQEAIDCYQESLALFRQLGDRLGQARALNNLGTVRARLGRSEEAIAILHQALVIYRKLDDPHGEASCLGNLGLTYAQVGRLEEAIASLDQGLVIARQLADLDGEAASLGNLGLVHVRAGRFQEAIASLEESLVIFRELGDRRGEAHSLNNLGLAHLKLGRSQEAITCQQDSLAIWRELGHRHGQAEALRDLGDALVQVDRNSEARERWLESLAIYELLELPELHEVRSRLAALPPEAVAEASDPSRARVSPSSTAVRPPVRD